jgi:hypothetical protein
LTVPQFLKFCLWMHLDPFAYMVTR